MTLDHSIHKSIKALSLLLLYIGSPQHYTMVLLPSGKKCLVALVDKRITMAVVWKSKSAFNIHC